ncbi:BTAD domain-containing putative transcriptional regulator [Streptomyces sp. NPDC102360]|uniref:AfsR/SARP family transcriptional regulator n=1 Tax=Streptomyces sp. NPDC102360 TaxID=3366160 RepID=UPI003830CDDC
MEFQILGPVEARSDGAPITLAGTKVHTVLAALLLARGRVVTDSRLSSLLWGWQPPATASAQLYTYVSRLRGRLGGGVEIVRRQAGYLLRTGEGRIDLLEFERLERLGREALRIAAHERAGALLRAALELWRGQALSNVTEQLARAECPRLEELRTTALENRIQADLALGRHQQLIAELTGLVTAFPLRERLRGQLMTALFRCGRQADALYVYHQGREVLAEELGVDPGSALNHTYRAVLTGDLELPRRAVALSVPSMLPPVGVEFTGRERESATLCGLLPPTAGAPRARRLLITGPAGAGKTTLAVRVAHAVSGEFPDGQLYADLCRRDGSPRDPCEVLVPLLRALGEPAVDRTGPASITDDLEELVRLYRTRSAGRRLLVLLDNAVNDMQLEPLLPGSQDIGVLVTSRTPLVSVADALTFELPLLSPPDGLRMLASVVGPRRVAAESGAAAEIVAHCAGLPLALRIAGARLAARPHWPLARLAARLRDPAGRLDELRFGSLSLADRLHSALRQVPPADRAAFPRLAPLGRGGFPAVTAAALLGVPEPVAERHLEALADARLLDLPGVDGAGRPLYRLHEFASLLASSLSTGATAELVA